MAGSRTVAMKRRRPLQRGQTNTSSANGFGGWVSAACSLGCVGQSLRRWLLALRSFAAARCWTVTEFVDHGVPGAKERRPALDALRPVEIDVEFGPAGALAPAGRPLGPLSAPPRQSLTPSLSREHHHTGVGSPPRGVWRSAEATMRSRVPEAPCSPSTGRRGGNVSYARIALVALFAVSLRTRPIGPMTGGTMP
jgi:hypothetical protein